MTIELIEIERLRERLHYDPELGSLRWRTARVKHRINAEAGVTLKSGYIKLIIDGKQVYAHRVAWAMHYGAWPSKQIDHINGRPRDNRIKNLREVEHIQNQQNALGSPHWYKSKRKWQVQLRAFGKRVNLGYFDKLEDAVEARRAAAERLRGEYARMP